jgi:hypothetical protein
LYISESLCFLYMFFTTWRDKCKRFYNCSLCVRSQKDARNVQLGHGSETLQSNPFLPPTAVRGELRVRKKERTPLREKSAAENNRNEIAKNRFHLNSLSMSNVRSPVKNLSAYSVLQIRLCFDKIMTQAPKCIYGLFRIRASAARQKSLEKQKQMPRKPWKSPLFSHKLARGEEGRFQECRCRPLP